MSLYNFFEKYIEETPELLMLTDMEKPVDSKELLDHFNSQQQRYPIEAFFNMLFYDSITRCSQNLREYELLRYKVKKISQIGQILFDLEKANYTTLTTKIVPHLPEISKLNDAKPLH